MRQGIVERQDDVRSIAVNTRAYPDGLLIQVMKGQSAALAQDVAMAALSMRRELKTALEGQQAQQRSQQPSVSDQMAQQEAGIGATPMEFADGGIVGYAAGRRIELKPGMTLSHIAAEQGVSVDDLMAMNKITDPTKIPAGTMIEIPGANKRKVISAPAAPAAPAAPVVAAAPAAPVVAAAPATGIAAGVVPPIKKGVLLPQKRDASRSFSAPPPPLPNGVSKDFSPLVALLESGNVPGALADAQKVMDQVKNLANTLSPGEAEAYALRLENFAITKDLPVYNAFAKALRENVGVNPFSAEDSFRPLSSAEKKAWMEASESGWQAPPVTDAVAPPVADPQAEAAAAAARRQEQAERDAAAAAAAASMPAALDYKSFLKQRADQMRELGITDPTTDIESNFTRREKRIDERAREQADFNLREGRGIAALKMAAALAQPGQSTAQAFGKAVGVAGEEAAGLRAVSQAAKRADEAARDRLEDARVALKQGNYKQFTDSYNEFWKAKNDQDQIAAYERKALLDAATTIRSANIAASARGAAGALDAKDWASIRNNAMELAMKNPKWGTMTSAEQETTYKSILAQLLGTPAPSPFRKGPQGSAPAVDMTK